MSFVVVGEVIKARGVRGELLIRPTAATMQRFLSLRSVWLRQTGPETEPSERREFVIERAKLQGPQVLVKFRGIDSREEATELNGSALEVPRSEVPAHPEGEHYMFELIGMRVTRTDGIELGTVAEVMETGSNIVYVVKDSDGKETLVPATREVVEKLDYENSLILVRPVPGLFD